MLDDGVQSDMWAQILAHAPACWTKIVAVKTRWAGMATSAAYTPADANECKYCQ